MEDKLKIAMMFFKSGNRVFPWSDIKSKSQEVLSIVNM